MVVTPEQFIRAINAVTLATAKSVSAGNSTRQEDITAAANMSRSAMTEMMRSCKVGFTCFCIFNFCALLACLHVVYVSGCSLPEKATIRNNLE